MVTTAELGLDTCAEALGAVSITSNVLSPENGVAVPMGMEIVFGVESFSAHCNTPDLFEKSLPATAVCETVV
jgi:L-asparaginase/Glu-tRNA(Gln) amidotransferase subunit D